MARLKALPSLDIIRGFKGVIDFYLWRGLPCARKWPRRAPGRRTEAEIASSALFGIITSNYRLLAPLVLAAFQEAAKDQPRTARDLYISAVYGHLHEASMTDFLTLLTECRDFLEALTAILNTLGSVDTDHLLAQVQASALPDGAATLAEQETQTTALQAIDDLRNALATVHTDELQVRGQDQLFSFAAPLGDRVTGNPDPATFQLSSSIVPAGQVWVVTTIVGVDYSTPLTAMYFSLLRGVTGYEVWGQVRAFGIADYGVWAGHLYLQENDHIAIAYGGALVTDTCGLFLNGHIMTKE